MDPQPAFKPAAVHPTSIVHGDCSLGRGVEVGPFCIIGPNVTLGEGTRLISHVTISSSTSLGRNCTVYPNAVVGCRPQDVKYAGEYSGLNIGDNAVIREGVTISIGTAGGNMFTRIGNRVHLMAGVHIGHDCQLGDNVTIANGVGLAGHVTIGDGAVLGGLAAVHQWCRIGTMAFVGGGSMVTRDVLPFSTVQGDRARTIGLNGEGLRRAGWGNDRISALQAALKLYLEGGQANLTKLMETEHKGNDILQMLDFARMSMRGICLPKQACAHQCKCKI